MFFGYDIFERDQLFKDEYCAAVFTSWTHIASRARSRCIMSSGRVCGGAETRK